jgi:hypothetical protein
MDACEYCGGEIPAKPDRRGPVPRFCSRACQVKNSRHGGENRNVVAVTLNDDEHMQLVRAARERDVSVKWLARRLVVEGLPRLKPASENVLTR